MKIDQAELQNQLVQIGIQTRFRLESLTVHRQYLPSGYLI